MHSCPRKLTAILQRKQEAKTQQLPQLAITVIGNSRNSKVRKWETGDRAQEVPKSLSAGEGKGKGEGEVEVEVEVESDLPTKDGWR